MSKLLTREEEAQAAAMGWGLHHVYEMETGRWTVRVLPAEASANVMNLARAGNALALKTLRLIAHGPEGKK